MVLSSALGVLGSALGIILPFFLVKGSACLQLSSSFSLLLDSRILSVQRPLFILLQL